MGDGPRSRRRSVVGQVAVVSEDERPTLEIAESVLRAHLLRVEAAQEHSPAAFANREGAQTAALLAATMALVSAADK